MIWYSKPARFNDPFDTRFYVTGKLRTYDGTTNSTKINAAFGEDMEGAMVSNKAPLDGELKSFQQEIEELGVLSLSTTNKNLLLWAHYGCEHKGMCLEFERINTSALSDDEATKKIFYTNNHPTLSTQSLINPASKKASMHRILFTKSMHWGYEDEWRHIVSTGDSLHPWPAPLKAVYFGCNTDNSDIQLVQRVINDTSIKYYQTEMNGKTFGLKFNKIS
ncbi:MAG: DUF2971 domain-containing protein [Gammaproteobacteria bacterium]|nr:DUF2971 domain-containing protein [Gammaproteobacteria bacterium]